MLGQAGSGKVGFIGGKAELHYQSSLADNGHDLRTRKWVKAEGSRSGPKDLNHWEAKPPSKARDDMPGKFLLISLILISS